MKKLLLSILLMQVVFSYGQSRAGRYAMNNSLKSSHIVRITSMEGNSTTILEIE